MKLTKDKVCVYIENEAQLQEAKELLEKHGEEIDDTMFYITKWKGSNFASKWRLDGKWRINNSERKPITLSQLEEILKNEVK